MCARVRKRQETAREMTQNTNYRVKNAELILPRIIADVQIHGHLRVHYSDCVAGEVAREPVQRNQRQHQPLSPFDARQRRKRGWLQLAIARGFDGQKLVVRGILLRIDDFRRL